MGGGNSQNPSNSAQSWPTVADIEALKKRGFGGGGSQNPSNPAQSWPTVADIEKLKVLSGG